MSHQDRVAVITGATGGLGKAVAAAFLGAGSRVVISYRDTSKLQELQDLLGPAASGLVALRADVTQEDQVKRLMDGAVERFGQLDILVNLAGGWVGGKSVQETEEAEFDRVLALNLKSAFLCCKAALPFMLERNYGKIVNVSSRAAVKPAAKQVGYNVAKTAVIALTESMAEETKKTNINTNAILPSIIDTPANRAALPKADYSTWVQPEDIAQIILFLTSDASKATSGASIPVYGKL